MIENTKEIIKDMIKSNKIPGAFIFECEQSGVRDLFARNLARAVVCLDAEHKKNFGEACGVCESCAKAIKNIHPDIITSEPEGEGNLSFHIEQVRDIIDGLYLSPNESSAKVYIIRDMHNMTPQGQNALLKSIEEPPPFAVFIITANNGDMILETVKSRAVRFALDHEEKSEEKKPAHIYGDLIQNILAETSDKLSLYQKLSSTGLDKSDKTEVINFYSCIENALRDILTAKIFMAYESAENTDNGGSFGISFLYFESFGEIEKLINFYSVKKILDLSKKIHKYKADLDYNINIKLNLTSFLGSLIV